MVTGRNTQLTRQIGEHLVTAKLGRMGYIATPFAGNVPTFDIIAVNLAGRVIPIQVKAIKGPSWQFGADTFLDIELRDSEQIVNGRSFIRVHPCPSVVKFRPPPSVLRLLAWPGARD